MSTGASQSKRRRQVPDVADDEFREKRDDVLRVYYEAPRNEHIVCVDEKTGIQALERRLHLARAR